MVDQSPPERYSAILRKAMAEAKARKARGEFEIAITRPKPLVAESLKRRPTLNELTNRDIALRQRQLAAREKAEQANALRIEQAKTNGASDKAQAIIQALGIKNRP